MARKTLYLLNIGDYAPELTALTYPFIERYADKIGAEIYMITERKFPDWDLDYEKLQIHDLSVERGDDWSIYLDSDALVHPETIDPTELLGRDTVAHNGYDMALVRWRYDDYFRRDGRNIGSCCWLMVASSWCRDFWKPMEDMSFKEAVKNISITVEEANTVIKPEHLITDYAVSRNIARYGLKFKSLNELWQEVGLKEANFFFHEYTVPLEEKVKRIRATIDKWKI